MDINVKGLRVIITAGGSGIGRVIAEKFSNEGAHVHICDIQENNLIECQSVLPDVGTTLCDVSDPQQVSILFQEAKKSLNGLDVLINGAGIAGPTAGVQNIEPDEWDLSMRIGINSQFYCARLAVPLLIESGGGSIINFSSSAGLMGYPFRSPYATAKWAVIGFTKTLAMELGQYQIRVNAMCPGSVEGERMDRVIEAEAKAKGMSEEEVRKTLVQGTSLKTFVSAEDIADMSIYLCSKAGSRITGQSVSVDGYTETLR